MEMSGMTGIKYTMPKYLEACIAIILLRQTVHLQAAIGYEDMDITSADNDFESVYPRCPLLENMTTVQI